ncbi:hypothetical protein OMP38_14850 [Cohnella ginsengisoli]|uniref:Uncharacterized protein n=1 Tax=Cohnella ginsengisoli TaxID=425004 RepID=A0A9X4KI64_9BACL|nr:hypothetical protein [Cohnella ginsengisoli]MDG0791994.1 hypothetical protein [Cohnella ginsengisoli]
MNESNQPDVREAVAEGAVVNTDATTDHANADYRLDEDSRPSGPIETRSVEEAMNGSMVQDFDDLKRLGRDMERVKTGSELSEEGLVSDPIQEKA